MYACTRFAQSVRGYLSTVELQDPQTALSECFSLCSANRSRTLLVFDKVELDAIIDVGCEDSRVSHQAHRPPYTYSRRGSSPREHEKKKNAAQFVSVENHVRFSPQAAWSTTSVRSYNTAALEYLHVVIYANMSVYVCTAYHRSQHHQWAVCGLADVRTPPKAALPYHPTV